FLEKQKFSTRSHVVASFISNREKVLIWKYSYLARLYGWLTILAAEIGGGIFIGYKMAITFPLSESWTFSVVYVFWLYWWMLVIGIAGL
ncbi:hypothetical protein NQU39_25585, partial [Escherichia coli]|uniref:hypothetical protein n=1 Tax=Escherichia coli TaxID=562 RepID=UPI0021186DE3